MISSPFPIVVRRTSHSNAGVPRDRYGFPNDIAQFISYSNIAATHRLFITSLDYVTLLKSWPIVKEDPMWKVVMHEELKALEKNKTWEIVSLPPRKKAVGSKWVFTFKHTQDARVVAKR